MTQPRLGLYCVDSEYIQNLQSVDEHVWLGKGIWPFVGLLVICKDKPYCVPLGAPKDKHKTMKSCSDFMKIFDGDKLIAVLNFNRMIPVREDVIEPLHMRLSELDNAEIRRYKKMASKQLDFCQKHQDAIVRKANKLYDQLTTGNASSQLCQRCPNFKSLELALNIY